MLAGTRIDLIVHRSDQEAVGALGACWDPDRRTWFVDAGAEIAPFLRWLPDEDRLAAANVPHPSGGNEPKGVSLRAFLTQVRQVLNAALPEPVWVRAEIRKVQTARSGNVYLELEERNEGNSPVAAAKGVIWADRYRTINGKFAMGTGGDLKPDIKVLLRVRAQFHPVYGFDLIIEDIDPSFTLGDLLARLRAIRATLRSEEVYESNRKLPAPREFVRVAVICPATSAGLGDFASEADRIDRAGLCKFDYYTALFQGADAPSSIREAMRRVHEVHQVRSYDALAIIRGGGSLTDLSWLNDLKLARWVCRVPIPVFTGIGHERDSTILDEVAHERFDTPSKVALHIAHAIRNNAWEALASLERIQAQVGRIVGHHETTLALQRDRLVDQFQRAIEDAGTAVAQLDREVRSTAAHQVREAEQALAYARESLADAARGALCDAELGVQQALDGLTHWSQVQLAGMAASVERLSQAVVHRAQTGVGRIRDDIERLSLLVGHRADARVGTMEATVDRQWQAVALQADSALDAATCALENVCKHIERDAAHRTTIAAGQVDGALGQIRSTVTAIHRSAGVQVESYARTIVGLGPAATLERGYAIARGPGGTPVGSRQEALQHRELTIQFRDGQVAVENRESQGEGP